MYLFSLVCLWFCTDRVYNILWANSFVLWKWPIFTTNTHNSKNKLHAQQQKHASCTGEQRWSLRSAFFPFASMKQASEHDQEKHRHCRPNHVTARKSHILPTTTRHQEVYMYWSKATSPVLTIKTTAKLKWHQVLHNKTRTKHRTPTDNGSNNKQWIKCPILKISPYGWCCFPPYALSLFLLVTAADRFQKNISHNCLERCDQTVLLQLLPFKNIKPMPQPDDFMTRDILFRI